MYENLIVLTISVHIFKLLACAPNLDFSDELQRC